MDAVDDHSHQVVQLKRNSSYSIADGDIGNAFKLPSDLLKEEMALLPGHFGESIAILIDLASDVILGYFLMVMVILGFHLLNTIIND